MKLNAKAARALRKEAGYQPNAEHVKMPFPGLHHWVKVPVYEMHTRVIRSWDPKKQAITGRAVKKIIYGIDGKTPLFPMYEEYTIEEGPRMGEKALRPKCELQPVVKPGRHSIKSPRGRYRLLKRLYKTMTDVEMDTFLAKNKEVTGHAA